MPHNAGRGELPPPPTQPPAVAPSRGRASGSNACREEIPPRQPSCLAAGSIQRGGGRRRVVMELAVWVGDGPATAAALLALGSRRCWGTGAAAASLPRRLDVAAAQPKFGPQKLNRSSVLKAVLGTKELCAAMYRKFPCSGVGFKRTYGSYLSTAVRVLHCRSAFLCYQKCIFFQSVQSCFSCRVFERLLFSFRPETIVYTETSPRNSKGSQI